MHDHYAPDPTVCPPAAARATDLRQRLHTFLSPLLRQLDAAIDARLVPTCQATVEAVLCFRHRAHGLLLSELGAFLAPPAHAPAGTKRLSNLLRCPKWTATLLADYLWQQARAKVQDWQAAGSSFLVIWDDSVLEKAESQALEGLCPVRSSKGARLARRRLGFSGPPPPRPLYVPGLRWLGLLLLGESGPPQVAALHWWSPRQPDTVPPAPETSGAWGAAPSPTHRVRVALLQRLVALWGRAGWHVCDRGFASGAWVGELLAHELRFILRWPKAYHLQDGQGQKQAAGAITRGKRAWEHRYLVDRRGEKRKVGVLAVAVTHPEHATPLWLVVARGVKKDQPWYLLTNEPIPTAAAAWEIVTRYGRRWRIEETFRFAKSELAMESPRLWTWERRLKLLGLVTLAYAFLLSLLQPMLAWLRHWLLRQFCHRTGQRAQRTPLPLYRLRSALSRLWLAHPALPPPSSQTPG